MTVEHAQGDASADPLMKALRPYPAYREVGLPWLPALPAHWSLMRGKQLLQCIDVRSTTGAEELLTVSSARGIVPRITANVTMFKAESYVGYKLCWPGDLVINSLWAWAGGLGVARHHGIVSSAYGVYRLRPHWGANSAFINELVRSSPFQWELQVRSKGVWTSRLQLTDDSFLGAPFPLPPSDEQAAIVRFIDHADRRIRKYITAKRKLIALLNEQKQAVITDAVTCGLNPSANRKPSGTVWLGDVPTHWVVASLRFRYDQCLGKMVDAKQQTGKHSIPYLRNVDVRWDHINTTDLPAIDIAPAERDRFTVKPGDLLVCEGRHLGRAAFWKGDIEVCGFQKALHRLRALNAQTDDSRFLFYCLYVAHIKDAFDASSSDNSIPHLTGEMLRAHRFPFPPKEEQSAIVAYLDETTKPIDVAIGVANRQIDLTRSYLARLVADVVTGKVDVRAAAAIFPVDSPDTMSDSRELFTDGEVDEVDADESEEAVA